MNKKKSNKPLIGIPHVSNKMLQNNENLDHHIININTMYINDDINENDNINNTEQEHLLKKKNKYIKYSSFEFEEKRNNNYFCIKGIVNEFLFYIGCLDKIN
jgi:hypothetical protein